MTSKTLGVVFTSLMFAGAVAFAQDPDAAGQTQTQTQTGTQQPYTTGQQQGTMGQQQAPYTSGQTGMSQTKQYTGTVTSLQPNKEVTVQTSDGKSHKYSLSSGANTTINPNVASGSQVMVTEGKDSSGKKVVMITPASPSGAATQQGTSGTSGGQTQY